MWKRLSPFRNDPGNAPVALISSLVLAFQFGGASRFGHRQVVSHRYRHRYAVDDHVYTGTRITSSDHAFSNKADAIARLDDLRTMSPLVVYYDPGNPAAAVLDQLYRPNIKSPWFWLSALLCVISLLIALRESKRLAPIAFRWLRRIARRD